MKKFKFFVMVLMTMALSMGFASCGDDDDEGKPTSIYIVNNSSYSLNRFTVVYLNERSSNDGEIISTQDFGTLNPQGHITASIPAGAAYYYLYMTSGSESYVSADYSISVTKLTIDNNFRWY